MQFSIKTTSRGSKSVTDVNLVVDHPPPPAGFGVDAWGGLIWFEPPGPYAVDAVLTEGRYIQHLDQVYFKRGSTTEEVRILVASAPTLRTAVEWLESFRGTALLAIDRYHYEEAARPEVAEGDDFSDFAV